MTEELDGLKDLWGKDDVNDTPEISLEQQEELHSPLEMVRLNMKSEFIITLITLPILFTDTNLTSDNVVLRTISIFIIIIAIAIISYFFVRIYSMYRKLNNKESNTNYGLFNLKCQLLVLKEIYRSYYLSYIPLMFIMYLVPIGFHFDVEYSAFIFTILFGVSIITILLIIKYWFKFMYGKYIDQVVYIIDDLNGVESNIIPRTRKSWFEKSQVFMISKLGIVGNILNMIAWVYAFILIVGSILGFILGLILILASKLNLINIHDLMDAMQKFNL